MMKPPMPRLTPVGLRPPRATPLRRQHVRINRQAVQLSEPKRCSEKPSHLSHLAAA